ncbi:hypothetical protein [Edaphobacter aggregans]|nr:hypothetical protein [Edaphobacter aggregans]
MAKAAAFEPLEARTVVRLALEIQRLPLESKAGKKQVAAQG